MSNINALLDRRLKKPTSSTKMLAMAEQTASGNLSSFSGVFSVVELNDNERLQLSQLLETHATSSARLSEDLILLVRITSEVKAINNQAALLHGERIKKAQHLLSQYREGAFTAWLITAYGNRQTPYNFLRYFEFIETLPKTLRPQVDTMPRQAVYTLATREGPLELKQNLIKQHYQKTKTELLKHIREAFPLPIKDRRRQNAAHAILNQLNHLHETINDKQQYISNEKALEISNLLQIMKDAIDRKMGLTSPVRRAHV